MALTPHALRIVILTYRAREPHVVLDFPKLAHTDPVEVHDGAARLDELSLYLGTHRQPLAQELLILDLRATVRLVKGETAGGSTARGTRTVKFWSIRSCVVIL
jgi:hypothetical protein